MPLTEAICYSMSSTVASGMVALSVILRVRQSATRPWNEKLLMKNGYKIKSIWECEWTDTKKYLPSKMKIEQQARDQSIYVRDALLGGRTKAFKSHYTCNEHEHVYYYDVVSLYPTVNALDDYAVGFKKYVNIHVDYIANGSFFGVAKADIIPPQGLCVPVLPDNSDGKLCCILTPCMVRPGAQ